MNAILLKIINILAIVLIISFVFYTKNTQKRDKSSLSFRQAMDLAELPVITMYSGDNKINFLLDTGSNDSLVASEYKDLLEVESIDDTNQRIAGFNGVVLLEIQNFNTKLYYGNQQFVVPLLISDHLKSAFDHIKESSGVQIHGILGSKFLEKYKYVLDFKDLVAYIR